MQTTWITAIGDSQFNHSILDKCIVDLRKRYSPAGIVAYYGHGSDADKDAVKAILWLWAIALGEITVSKKAAAAFAARGEDYPNVDNLDCGWTSMESANPSKAGLPPNTFVCCRKQCKPSFVWHTNDECCEAESITPEKEGTVFSSTGATLELGQTKGPAEAEGIKDGLGFRFRVVIKLTDGTTDWKKCTYYQRFKVRAETKGKAGSYSAIGIWPKSYSYFSDLDSDRRSEQPSLSGDGLTEGYAEDWKMWLKKPADTKVTILGPKSMKEKAQFTLSDKKEEAWDNPTMDKDKYGNELWFFQIVVVPTKEKADPKRNFHKIEMKSDGKTDTAELNDLGEKIESLPAEAKPTKGKK